MRFRECGLTPRSSRAPTAGHAGPVGGTRYIFANRARASHRWCQLSSNVSPHTDMTRKSKNRARPPQQVAPTIKVPWYKRVWVVVSATSVVVSAILLKGPTLLQNARTLPGEVRQTASDFQSWAKEDAAWTGHWSSFPEGIVDMADMRLSNVDMQITIWASQGNIDGTIATKSICRSLPVLNYVLLRGEVSGNTANVIAWDILQGHKTDFAELKLVRDGDVVTVTPASGRKDWFPATARLGRHPDESGVDPEPDRTFCAEERKAFFKKTPPLSANEG